VIETISDTRLREGHYAAKQIFCRDGLIARPSPPLRSRPAPAARFRPADPRLRHGDGTFLALLQATAPPLATVGAELDDGQVDDCRRRFAGRPGLGFLRIGELDDRQHAAAYQGVVCMEVLEHVVAIDAVLHHL
jgi:hypothetical protein